MTGVRKNLSFAVIGCSGIAPSYIKGLKQIPGVNVTHIYSRSVERANSFASKFDLIPCSDSKKIFCSAHIDAVIIATDPARHFDYGCHAMKSGKHVLIEKPLALDLDDAQRLVNLAEVSGVITSVVSQFRYDDTVINVRDQLKAEQLGEPILVKGSLIWNRDEKYFSKGDGWRGDVADVLTNQGIHLLDIILFLFGEPRSAAITFSNVNSLVSTYDTAILNMKFEKKLNGTLNCTTASAVDQGMELTIIGTKGLITIRSSAGRFVRSWAGLQFPEKINQPLKWLYLPITKSPLQKQIEDFVEAIRDNRSPRVSLVDGQKVLRLIRKSYQLT